MTFSIITVAEAPPGSIIEIIDGCGDRPVASGRLYRVIGPNNPDRIIRVVFCLTRFTGRKIGILPFNRCRVVPMGLPTSPDGF